MKVHIYTDIHVLYGRGAMVWMNVLLAAGHDVEYIDIGVHAARPLPDVGPCDVNLVVGGVNAFQRFIAQGLPRHGRHVLCIFEPLTLDETSWHRVNARLIDALAPRIHGAVGMDEAIVAHLRRHHPRLPARRIPHLIAAEGIAQPQAESGKSIDVLWFGRDSERRRHAAQLFDTAGVKAQFLWTHVWGLQRERLRYDSRIALNVHADGAHTYFDQFRTLEAWAAGAVVVAETSDDLAQHGIVPGVHMAVAELEQLPALCAQLLADAPRRQAMARAAQDLLREQFTPDRWRADMLAAVEAAADSA